MIIVENLIIIIQMQNTVKKCVNSMKKVIKMGNPFKCPNCNKVMNLEFECKDIEDFGIYDVWGCEDCCHIQVLDYRG